MFIHLSFTDGSNPWFCFGDDKECDKRLKEWEAKYVVDTKNVLNDKKEKVGVMGIVHIPKDQHDESFL